MLDYFPLSNNLNYSNQNQWLETTGRHFARANSSPEESNRGICGI
jgi:hypothetical protein